MKSRSLMIVAILIVLLTGIIVGRKRLQNRFLWGVNTIESCKRIERHTKLEECLRLFKWYLLGYPED